MIQDAKLKEFELVSSMRKAISGVGVGATPETAATYQHLYERLVKTDKLPEDAESKSDYFLRRAAIVFTEAQHAREALRARDRSAEGSSERSEAVAELQRIERIFQRYPPDPQRLRHASDAEGLRWCNVRAKKEAEGWIPRNQSKRVGLGSLVRRTGWEDEVFGNISILHQDAAAVAMVTGARPSEISKGVVVTRQGNQLLVTIKGAKCNAARGQPERALLINVTNAASKHLFEIVRTGPLTITTKPKCLTDAFARAGRRAYPRLRMNVSPYTFRHYVAACLKSSGVASDDISRAMGHLSSRSAQSYGLVCHGKRSTGIVAVRAALPVRDTRRNPPFSHDGFGGTPRIG